MIRKFSMWLVALALTAGAASMLTWGLARRIAFQVPTAASSVTEVRPTASVLLAVQALARLESVSFHMERVLDLSDKQSRLFGLIESEDALLLVAVANVTAGIDLGKLSQTDVVVDAAKRRVFVRLPQAEIFMTALDNEHTYVHSRRTGLMAQRKEDLESKARTEAERTLLEAARQAGILPAASNNARRAVEALLRSLGFEWVEVVAQPTPDSAGLMQR